MWPIQLAFLLFIVLLIFLSSLTPCDTSSFLTRSVQLIFFILTQRHIQNFPGTSNCVYIHMFSDELPSSLALWFWECILYHASGWLPCGLICTTFLVYFKIHDLQPGDKRALFVWFLWICPKRLPIISTFIHSKLHSFWHVVLSLAVDGDVKEIKDTQRCDFSNIARQTQKQAEPKSQYTHLLFWSNRSRKQELIISWEQKKFCSSYFAVLYERVTDWELY